MSLKGLREGRVDIEAESSVTLIYGLTPPRRGRFEFGYTALRFRSRLRLVWRETKVTEPANVKVYPKMRRAREAESKALGARSVVSSHRKTSRPGEVREFESMRDDVTAMSCDTFRGPPPSTRKVDYRHIRLNATRQF